jgi:hypothetical protein
MKKLLFIFALLVLSIGFTNAGSVADQSPPGNATEVNGLQVELMVMAIVPCQASVAIMPVADYQFSTYARLIWPTAFIDVMYCSSGGIPFRWLNSDMTAITTKDADFSFKYKKPMVYPLKTLLFQRLNLAPCTQNLSNAPVYIRCPAFS